MFWKQGGCLLLLLLRCDCLLALHQGGRQQNKRKEEEEGKNTLMAYWMDSLKAEANHPAKLLALLAEEGLSESRTAEITSPLLSPSFSYFSSTFSSKFIRAHPPESNRIESEHFPSTSNCQERCKTVILLFSHRNPLHYQIFYHYHTQAV